MLPSRSVPYAAPLSLPAAARPQSRWFAPGALLRQPFNLAVLLLVVLSISKVGGYWAIGRTLRPAFLAFAFAVVYAVANPRALAMHNLLRFPLSRVQAALAVVACASAVFGISLGRAASFMVQDYWKTLAMAFLILLTLRTTRDFRRLTIAVAFAGVLLAVISLFIVGISKTANAIAYDANDVGLIMLTTLPMLLLVMQTSTGRTRLAALAGAVLVLVTLGATESRGAFLGLVCVAICLLFMLPGIAVSKRLLIVAATGVGMVAFMPAQYRASVLSLASNPESDYNFNSVDGRVNIWKRGIGYMIEYPVFGVGISNFPRAEGTISDKARNAPPNTRLWWNAAHNSYIQAGAETGVTGLLLWCWLLFGGMLALRGIRRRIPVRWWRSGTADQRFLYLAAIYLPVSFVGFGASAFFVSFAWNEPIYILTALAIGAAISLEHEMRPYVTPRQRHFRSDRGKTTGVADAPAEPADGP